jgi:hypothetical protein
MYPRTIKVRSTSGTVNEYVRVVEAYRDGGKVRQRVVADLGRKDLLVEILPKLRRLLAGDSAAADTGDPLEPQVLDASTWGADPRRPGLVRPTRPLGHPRPRTGAGQRRPVRRPRLRAGR